ncbi:YdeI/OmpD-associated family protein [Frigoribacterium sp. VKM Ac-2836]|uniref:YdeI/OmpD-associated family protein n=1 Tax=Frigoribacterium sp. VKM Ac-2836 TaxID=2739014 RepID=UPI001563A7F4|nr:YdeI/OmpD-associated family protein [Frigoribacterium sp. VKM Ac-2836]NRD26875.1 DUF1905 domain-containing protein [Frigoribacterium sp. VKM Ac-2836]
MTEPVTFRTVIAEARTNATGIVVPPEVVDALASGKKPAVLVTVEGYTYRGTVASMGGRYLVPARASYEALSYSRQRALVEPIGAAKTPETRARRLAAVLASLTG